MFIGFDPDRGPRDAAHHPASSGIPSAVRPTGRRCWTTTGPYGESCPTLGLIDQRAQHRRRSVGRIADRALGFEVEALFDPVDHDPGDDHRQRRIVGRDDRSRHSLHYGAREHRAAVTLSEGTNVMVRRNPERIAEEAFQVLDRHGKDGRSPALWNGHAAESLEQIHILSRRLID